MGQEITVYHFTEQESQQIDHDINQLVQPIKSSLERDLSFFLFKKVFLLSKRNPSEDFQMVKGRVEIPTQQYQGWMSKEGGSHKSWKRRMVILYPNKTIKYFENELSIVDDKPKGSLSLEGYEVVDDPIAGQNQRNQAIAEIIGWTDRSKIPPPNKYPPLTIELFHPQDRVWHFVPETFVEKAEWVKRIKTALVPLPRIDHDWGYRRCFKRSMIALLATMRKSGSIRISDSEVETLFSLCGQDIEMKVFGGKYKELKGKWEERVNQYYSIHNTTCNYVNLAITDHFKNINRALASRQSELEAFLSSENAATLELFQTFQGLKDKASQQGQALNLLKQLLAEHLLPHIDPTYTLVDPPLKNCFLETDRQLRTICDHMMDAVTQGKVPQAITLGNALKDFIKPYVGQAVEISTLDNIMQYCDELGQRVDGIRTKQGTDIGHVNGQEIALWLRQVMMVFLVRAFYSLEAEMSIAITRDAEAGSLKNLRDTLSSSLDMVFERFKFDACVLARAVQLKVMHSLLDQLFLARALPSVQSILAFLQTEISVPPYTTLAPFMYPQLILEEILIDFIDTTLLHQLDAKLPKIPAKSMFYALPTGNEVDEDYLENLY